MNAVDATAHYNQRVEAAEDRSSLLVVILDTNPFAWDALSPILPISQALANVLLFINAHLAFSHANKAAVIASHTKSARLLYPAPLPSLVSGTPEKGKGAARGGQELLNLADRVGISKNGGKNNNGASTAANTPPLGDLLPGTQKSQSSRSLISNPERDANKYRQFRIVEDEVTAGAQKLMEETSEETLEGTNMTMMAGALTLALTFIHRSCIPMDDTSVTGAAAAPANTPGLADIEGESTINARILVISVSGDLAFQYIPIMNSVFAAQRKKIPIDICKVSGDTVFLQQASDATNGIYMSLEDPRGLLQYLMMGFLPDQSSRKHLVLPTQVNVDFRAACFCHKRVVDIGFVCSICLSIFCSPPAGSICPTCSTKLDVSNLGAFGGKPVVIVAKKKKKRKADKIIASSDE